MFYVFNNWLSSSVHCLEFLRNVTITFDLLTSNIAAAVALILEPNDVDVWLFLSNRLGTKYPKDL